VLSFRLGRARHLSAQRNVVANGTDCIRQPQYQLIGDLIRHSPLFEDQEERMITARMLLGMVLHVRLAVA
jgi:hypothetical protein